MTIKVRKKTSRQRGSRWHGWGRGAAHHKGAGNRGGRGNAGSGKRADQKKPSYWKEKYFGKDGFKSKNVESILAINVSFVNEHIDQMAKKEGNAYNLDLNALGFQKLLGSGKITKPVKVTVKYATQSAIDKVTAAKGNVVLLAEKESKIDKE